MAEASCAVSSVPIPPGGSEALPGGGIRGNDVFPGAGKKSVR